MQKIQYALESSDELELIETDFTDTYTRDMYFTHYPKSGGIVGRRLIYKIKYKGVICGVIGIQSVAMCYLNAVRFLYGFNKTTEEIRNNYYEEVYNNNIFRLEKNDKNLASQVLALFRKRVQKDMQRKYNVNIRAILSLTYGTNEFGIVRTGKCYLADNWKFLCLTKGMRIHHGFGRDGEAAEWNVVKDGEKKSFFIYDFRKRKR